MRKSEDAGEIWNLSHDVCWQTWLSLLEVILKLFCGKGWLELKVCYGSSDSVALSA